MAGPWHRPLAGLIDDFAARKEDLRHILLTIDAEALEVPSVWMDQDPEDGIARWGLPPDIAWRTLPGEREARPVVVQEAEFGFPLCWKHTFYGVGAFTQFRRLAYRVVRSLADIPPGHYAGLSAAMGLPPDPPLAGCPTPHLWWTRALHGIALMRHPGSELWANCGAVRADPKPAIISQARPEIEEVDRPDFRRFDVSILEGDIFSASMHALEILRVACVPRIIVRVTPLIGGARYDDVGGAGYWVLRDVLLSQDQFPGRMPKPAPPQYYPSIDRFAYRVVMRTTSGRYLLLGAMHDYWDADSQVAADVLIAVGADDLRRRAPFLDIPVRLDYREITKNEALELLIASNHSDDLISLLNTSLPADFRPPQPPEDDTSTREVGEAAQDEGGEVVAPDGLSQLVVNQETPPENRVEWFDLVTLDQAAGMVHKSKRTLEREKTKGTLPPPSVEGGGGKADLYFYCIPHSRSWFFNRGNTLRARCA